MRTAKLFLAGMYLHLLLSVVTPVGILYLGWAGAGWNRFNGGLLLFYLAMLLLVQLLGWSSAGASILAYRRSRTDRLLAAWRTLKLGSVPFYLVNFLWSFLVWGALTAASRGIFLLLVPIPVCVTWLLIIQSGITGWLAVRSLREEGANLSGLWSTCQFLPVLDVLTALALLRRAERKTLESRGLP